MGTGVRAPSIKKPADQWMIQAGISKNVFGYGATTAYGEYGVANDWGADITCGSTGTQSGGVQQERRARTRLVATSQRL